MEQLHKEICKQFHSCSTLSRFRQNEWEKLDILLWPRKKFDATFGTFMSKWVVDVGHWLVV